MIEIEKYARAAASTARTPPNSPARQAAIEAENTARVAAEQFVKGLEAERDALRDRLRALNQQFDHVAEMRCQVTGERDALRARLAEIERMDRAAALEAAR